MGYCGEVRGARCRASWPFSFFLYLLRSEGRTPVPSPQRPPASPLEAPLRQDGDPGGQRCAILQSPTQTGGGCRPEDLGPSPGRAGGLSTLPE